MHIAGFKFSASQPWPERLTETPMPEAKRDTLANEPQSGIFLHSIAANVAATAASKPKTRGKPENFRPNRHGRPLLIRKGSRGSGGLRADLRDGTVTNREIAMMSDKDLAKRYRVCIEMAIDLREIVVLYGGGSAYRDAQGKPRATPIKRASTATR